MIAGGYFFRPYMNIESRLAFGPVHQVVYAFQFHNGLNYYPLHPQGYEGFYIGMYLKYWDNYNRLTKIHFYNMSPYLVAGKRWNFQNMFLDIRINQTLMAISWSSLEHTRAGTSWQLSPWPAFIPIIPTITLSMGFNF